jgi:hypothetical protein
MKKLISYFVLTLLSLTSSFVTAQEADSSKARPVQVSFAYPLGTNGASSLDYSNNETVEKGV